MAIENVVRRRALLLERIGKTGLNIQYPDEFELYVLALELLDSNGKTLKYFIFPVNPSNIDDTTTQIHNIKKTLNGVSVLSSTSFVPTDIIISGDFGRKFRVLLGEDYTDLIGSFSESNKIASQEEGKKITFDLRAKTGYGCCKILEEFVQESNKVTGNGNVKTLIFHNLALGHSHIVKPMSIRFNMSQDSNMIWKYTLTMKSIAPLSALYNEEELRQQRFKLGVGGYLQDKVDNVVNSLTQRLGRLQEKYG